MVSPGGAMRCGDEVFGVAEGALRLAAQTHREYRETQRILLLNLREPTIHRLL